RRVDQRQGLGPTGRHDRHRRQRQWNRRRAPELFQQWRPWHPDRRRAIAEPRGRRNLRDLLQLRADRFDKSVGRLPVHRQSGLQHRSRAGESVRRTYSLAILKSDIDKPRPPRLSSPRIAIAPEATCQARPRASEEPEWPQSSMVPDSPRAPAVRGSLSSFFTATAPTATT